MGFGLETGLLRKIYNNMLAMHVPMLLMTLLFGLAFMIVDYVCNDIVPFLISPHPAALQPPSPRRGRLRKIYVKGYNMILWLFGGRPGGEGIIRTLSALRRLFARVSERISYAGSF